MSLMAEETEREKPKFVCKLCKLDYPSSVQFEEHLWSMLHHKAINNKKSGTKHHCNVCMFESFDLNAYGKHLIGDRHKRSLVERRKRLEEPRQTKATTPSTTSCSKKSDSQTEQASNQRIKSSYWGPPTHQSQGPNQSGFDHGGYPQSQGPNQSGFDHGGYPQSQGPNQSGFNHQGYPQSQGPNQSGFNHGRYPQSQGPNQSGFNHQGYPQSQGPNQSGFDHGRYHQSQGPNTFQQSFRSNTDNDYQEHFTYNQGQGKWQNPHNSYSSHPYHGRFGLPSVGSWENNSLFDPRQMFSTPFQAEQSNAQFNPTHGFPTQPQALQQHHEKYTEKSTNRPGKPNAQGKVGKKKGKHKAHWKNKNMTSKMRKASHQSFAAKGSSGQGCLVKKPAPQHVHAEKALSVKKDIQSESVPNVKVSRGSTPSINRKKKKQKKPSPKIKPNGHPKQTGTTPKPTFKTQGKFAKKKKGFKSSQNQSPGTSLKSSIKPTVKESIKPSQSSDIALTKESAPSKDMASSTSSFPKTTSVINRFEMNLREALQGSDVGDDEVGKVTSSDVAGVSGKTGDHSVTPSSPIVSSSAAGMPFQFSQEQYTGKKGQSAPKAHSSSSSSSLGKENQTFKINHQKETIASSNETNTETAAGLLPTLATSMSPCVSSVTAAVSSFHSLHKQIGKWSAEVKCASSLDKLSSKTHTATTGLVMSNKLASKIHIPTESTSMSDNPTSNIDSHTRSSGTGTSVSNIHSRIENSSTGISDNKPTSNFERRTENLNTGTGMPDKLKSSINSHKESSITSTSVRNIVLSSSTSTPQDCSNHKELIKCKSEETGSDESGISNFSRSSSSPATLITVGSQSKELSAENKPLLSKVLVNEKQKLNPRPNLTNARTRLRTNKDAEHSAGGQLFKEKIQGLLSDVAKPVWQQKKLHMMLAKAKKTPDRFNRFNHPVSSPNRSEDPMESLDIMNLSTEFQQELLELIQSEDADEEDILSQLAASEASEALQEKSHTLATATPGSIQPQGLQVMLNPSHPVRSMSTTPVIKLEPLDSTELMDSHVYQPSFGSEQSQYERHSRPGLISTNESCAMPEERSSTERSQTLTSASHVFSQESLTIGDLDTHAPLPSQPYKEWNHPGHSAPENPEGSGPSERHDASVTSTSTLPSMTVDPNSTEESETVSKVRKDKKKKSKKSTSKEEDPSTSKKIKKKSQQAYSPKFKASKSTSWRRKSVQSNLSVSRTKSPAVLTANKLKEKLKQKRRMLDTTAGDMNNLLEITLEENKLQAKMDKLTAKIENIVEIIHEKETKLKRYKQQKDMFMSSLGDLREKRLNLLLGLTSGEKSDSSLSKRNGSKKDERPSSTTTRDVAPAKPRASLQVDHQADSSNAEQSGGEGNIKISKVSSMASSTPSHRTEGFRIMFGSPARPEEDKGHGLMDIFRDAGCNQDEQGIAIGSPPMQPYASQNIEMVPQVMSRESLARTLQELKSCGGGVTVDILSDEETLYGIGRERLRHTESHPPNGDTIGTVAQPVRGHVMSPDTDSGMQMSDATVEPYQMVGGSDHERVQRETTNEYGSEGRSLLRFDREERLSVIPNRNTASYESTLKRIKQEPQDHDDIGQPQETFVHEEPSFPKQKRRKVAPEENQSKRRKPNPRDPIIAKVKQELDTLLETTSNAYLQEQGNTPLPEMENPQFPPYPTGSKDNGDNHSKPSTSHKEKRKLNTNPQTAHQASAASSLPTSSLRTKGYVINMCIMDDKLYACISDSRFIIFNLTTNKIDTEEDLALGNIKYFELWRDAAASRMVAFASDGSKNLVQFNVEGNEFLQTLVLGRDITCLHVKWNTLYAGLVNGDIASISIQKSKVSWYYDCTPTFAVTAISSTLEGGMALLITASEDRTVTIRRAEDGLLIRSLDGHLDVVTHLQVMGCLVMSMARNSTILIHNLETGDLTLRVKLQTKIACCVMSGDTLAMAGQSGNVYYYKIESGEADIYDTGCGNITCMTASQDMLFLGIRDGFIDVIPLYPSTVYKCEWNHCISRFLRLDALKTHLQLIHIRRSARQCLWRSCLKNYPSRNTTLKTMEQHVFSHLKDIGKE